MKISKEGNTEIDKIQVLSFKEDTTVKFKNSKLMILIMNKTKDNYEWMAKYQNKLTMSLCF